MKSKPPRPPPPSRSRPPSIAPSNSKKLAATGFKLPWQPMPVTAEGKAKKASKTKFTCPDCGQNAWAKPDAALICGDFYDEDDGTVTAMLPEPKRRVKHRR